MHSSRRHFLKTGAALATATAYTTQPLLALPRSRLDPFDTPAGLVHPINDPGVKQLAMRGLDAAREAGAVYADVRLSHRRVRELQKPAGYAWNDEESMTVGVRALANGYWGFASAPVWNPEELVRLSQAAVSLARTNSLGKPRRVDLAPVSAVTDGHWSTPVTFDPFEISREEIADHLVALGFYSKSDRFPAWGLVGNNCFFTSTDTAFGSTDGGYWTQRLVRGRGVLSYNMTGPYGPVWGGLERLLSLAGKGWELYRDQPIREGIRELYEELKEDASFPIKPVDVGRYDAVLDAPSLAELVNQSIGAATQLDRALGYEANAGGTSYINLPEEMLGVLKIGAPLLTVTANRNAPGAAATVKWDDDGVEPDEFTVVKEGMLVDFLTNREEAGWMREWSSTKASLRSHGCAAAPQAVDIPLTHTPNLVMSPGQETLDFPALVHGMSHGIAIKRGSTRMDFQQLNGYGRGTVFEVKKGKRVARFNGAGWLLRAPEFWRSLIAIGGPGSVERYGETSDKGEPPQSMGNSVTAVPAVVKDMTIIDVLRKA